MAELYLLVMITVCYCAIGVGTWRLINWVIQPNLTQRESEPSIWVGILWPLVWCICIAITVLGTTYWIVAHIFHCNRD